MVPGLIYMRLEDKVSMCLVIYFFIFYLCKLVMKTSKGCCFVYFKINKLRHICTIFQFETTPKLDNMVCSNMI